MFGKTKGKSRRRGLGDVTGKVRVTECIETESEILDVSEVKRPLRVGGMFTLITGRSYRESGTHIVIGSKNVPIHP